MHRLTELRQNYLARCQDCQDLDTWNEQRRKSARETREALEEAASRHDREDMDRLTNLLRDLEAAHKDNRDKRIQAWEEMRRLYDEIADFYEERLKRQGDEPVDWSIHLEKQLEKDELGRVTIDRINCIVDTQLCTPETEAIVNLTRLCFVKQHDGGGLSAGFTYNKRSDGREVANALLPLVNPNTCPTVQVMRFTNELDVLGK